MISHSKSGWRIALDYIVCYLFWIVLAAGGFWLLFSIRQNLMDIAIAAEVNPWFPQAVDKWGTFVLGMIWIVWIFILEARLRHSVERNQFWQSLGRAALFLIIIAAISMSLRLAFS